MPAKLWALRAELAVALGILAGWALLTHGIAAVVRGPVWRISAGLFLLSLVGWRFLFVVCRDGLYTLSREKPSRG